MNTLGTKFGSGYCLSSDPAPGRVQKRVVLINNYNMQAALECYRQGQQGSHHLWGALQFPGQGLNVCIPPQHRCGRLIGWVGNHRWGDLDQELRLGLSRRFDVVYCACDFNVRGLAFLRGLHLWRKPIVTVMHHCLEGGWQPALCAKGMDRIICLAPRVADKLIQRFPEKRRAIHCVPWGVDTTFLRPSPSGGECVISAGKSLRDYNTLCRALAEVRLPAAIFCSEDSAPQVAVPEWVQIVKGAATRNPVTESELQLYYDRAFVVAIPLPRLEMLGGLTSLLDAMAHAKPVIVTRNDFLGIDVEREGIGVWVEPGDTAGWVKALRRFQRNPQEAADMGIRGRHLCETRYNIDRFAQEVAGIIKTL